jgi:Dehydratase medium subunit
VLDAEPIYQRESFPESPAIHVAVLPDVEPIAFRWVTVGAEEEGIPCRGAPAPAEPGASGGEDPVTAAYAAARESRLGVGVAVGRGRVILHEAHMPAERPVWELPLAGELRQACRLVGCNAGRMVKRMPLRFEQDSTLSAGGETRTRSPGGVRGGESSGMTAPEVTGAEAQVGAADLAAIVVSIVRALQERGVV